MSDSFVTMGVDVSKVMLDVCYKGKHRRFDNNARSITKLITLIKKEGVSQVVLEATDGYEVELILACNKAKIRVCRVNPRQVRDFAKAKGVLAKTDRIDAEVIVSFALAFDLRPTELTASATLSSYVKHRQMLLEQRGNMQRRHKQVRDAEILSSLAKMIGHLDKEIAKWDAKISLFISADKSLARKKQLITSIPGIAEQTSSKLLAYLPEMGVIDSKCLAALAGLAPYNCDSGMYKGAKRTQGGRQEVRNALYMAAFVAIKCNPPLKAFFEKLIKTKPYKVAITAVMRKMLTICNAIVKNNLMWENNYAK